MAPRGTDLKILSLAAALVGLAAAAAAAGFFYCAGRHPAAQLPVEDGSVSDAAPLPLPDDMGPRCGTSVVRQVRSHPSKLEGAATIEAAVEERLQAEAERAGERLLLLGWRGREDRQKRSDCRVSLRYQLGDQRGATVWLVDPDQDRTWLEPQDRLSIELTALPPWPDAEAQRAMERRCADEGVEKVKRHFSYMENFSVWRCLRKRAGQYRRETGRTVEYNRWKGEAEAPDRCLVSVEYFEEEVPSRAYYRLRFIEGEEHAVEPLTAKAIESIYGPGVTSR